MALLRFANEFLGRVNRRIDLAAKSFDGRAQRFEQAFQLGEHRCLGVRLEADRSFIWLPQYQSQVHHYAEFPMRRACTHAGFAGDLAQMKPLIRVPEQQR